MCVLEREKERVRLCFFYLCNVGIVWVGVVRVDVGEAVVEQVHASILVLRPASIGRK